MIRTIMCFYELLHSRENEQQQLVESSFLKKLHCLCPQAQLHLHHHKFGYKQLYALLHHLGFKFATGIRMTNYSNHGQSMWSKLFNTRLVGKKSKSIHQQFTQCIYTDGVAVSVLVEKNKVNGSSSLLDGSDDCSTALYSDDEDESGDEADTFELPAVNIHGNTLAVHGNTLADIPSLDLLEKDCEYFMTVF